MGVSSKEGQTFQEGSWLGRSANTLVEAVKGFLRQDGMQWSAAIAYYSLLSTFPLLLAVASIGAYFVDPDWVISQVTSLLGEYLPQGEGQIKEIVQGAQDARGGVSIISLAVLLWSGTRVFGVLARALNLGFSKTDKYGFFQRRVVELLMAVTFGLLFIIALISRLLIRFLWSRLIGESDEMSSFLFILQLIIPAVLLFTVFYLVYRFVPNRKVDPKAALAGAVLATILFSAARPLFLRYLNQFAEYNLIYGSLAVLTILIVWFWITALIVLFGGQVTSSIQQRHIDADGPERAERAA